MPAHSTWQGPGARIGAALLFACALASPMCGQPIPSAPGSAVPEIDRTTGEYFYLRHCSDCHGRDGRGTVVGFPLVGRPSGPVSPDLLIASLRTPLQMMPRYPQEFLSDDVARLIAYHVATLENKASGAAIPDKPDIAAGALRPLNPLPPVPGVGPADAKTYDMKEYDSPCGAGESIAVGPDGRVWYSATQQHKLAAFNPKTEKFQCWTIPTRNGRPYGIGVDKDGFVWIASTGLPDNKVAMFDPKTELFTETYLPHSPQPFPYPHTLTFDADRSPVFSDEYGDGVGRIERKTGRVDYFPIPTFRARPTGIVVAKSGHIFVAEFTGNKIADLDPKTGKVVELVHPRAAEDPGVRNLALDGKGNIWLSEHEFGSIGFYDAKTKKWKSWRAPANGGMPTGLGALIFDKSGIWFSHDGGNYIGRFDPGSERFAVYPLVTKDLACHTLDVVKDGSLWCIGSRAAKLVHLSVKSTR